MQSVWSKTVKLPEFESLSKDKKTDVLIIGGGIAGLLCAYMLKQSGIDYILVEASRICGGITKNTTAKITALHGLVYDRLIHEVGLSKAQMYYEANEEAIREYARICENIDCDFEVKSAVTYSVNDAKKIQNEIKALKRIGINAGFCTADFLPFDTCGGIMLENQAQFNPLKFLSAISRDLNIYENTRVTEIRENVAFTDNGKVFANKIIVASHFPFINKHGNYFLKMYQHRSYVIALENAPLPDAMYVDEAEKGLSFRSYKNLLLVGGGAHRTGKSGGNYTELELFAKMHYPDAKVKYKFATQDCMTLDRIPYIGNYSKNTADLYVVTGFNKWGMTSSMAAARILCDMICKNCNRYAEAFSPSRTILRPQLAVNAFEATTNLLTITKKRCPHLGCALKWNKIERTWDCACHGSRFAEDGKLIDNPATGDLK